MFRFLHFAILVCHFGGLHKKALESRNFVKIQIHLAGVLLFEGVANPTLLKAGGKPSTW